MFVYLNDKMYDIPISGCGNMVQNEFKSLTSTDARQYCSKEENKDFALLQITC